MWLLAAVLTAVCFGINNTLFKWSTRHSMSKQHIQLYFYLVAFIMMVSYGWMNEVLHPSLVSVCLGALVGICNATGNLQMSIAFEKGPASLTAPLIAVNAIFPVLAAGIVFDEHIPLLHWLGILCMLCSVAVIQYTPNEKGNHEYIPWLGHIGVAIISFGAVGVLMKVCSTLGIGSLDVLTAMYGGGSLYLLLRYGKEKGQKQEFRLGATIALFSVIGFSCYFYALNEGIATIVFPVVSLNCLVVVMTGCYIFKEKLKAYQIVGIVTALFGLILTKL
ncbi:DMT family transporter [Thermaerobacillus caldiproteolyticus]|uniref:Drug/metabolite transporter (DMT)-like permease n=1 Tax=Thermaerobacillus caldiproteolyticus TaxID=247480 RepID=A0A7W0C060_9BACL|nr:DMT family transporter [Anoxybacillus caldiproteolyticus]MBA2875201.1 drug/metabolite transporter (DMT)-like permease [Anoxybacillus caldiproteolyticus]